MTAAATASWYTGSVVPAGVATVFLLALLTAVATGLGALPFAFAKHPTRRWLGASNAVAAGLMLAASFGLIYEGVNHGPSDACGRAPRSGVHRCRAPASPSGRAPGRLRGHGRPRRPQGALDRRGHDGPLLHRGVGIGVSFGGGEALGLFISLALAVHNIPEGLAISLVLVPRGGMGPRRVVEHLLQFAAAPDGCAGLPLRRVFRELLPYGLGFAAGAMIWMVFSELVPDALEEASENLIAVVITLSIVAMVAFQVLIREADPKRTSG